jgi:hypothetical protein
MACVVTYVNTASPTPLHDSSSNRLLPTTNTSLSSPNSEEEQQDVDINKDITMEDHFNEQDYTAFGLDACSMDFSSGLDADGVDLQSNLPTVITIKEDFDAEVNQAGMLSHCSGVHDMYLTSVQSSRDCHRPTSTSFKRYSTKFGAK